MDGADDGVEPLAVYAADRTVRQDGRIEVDRRRRRRFPSRYTAEDMTALARVDQAHERLSGSATRAILKREFGVYGKAEFERLAAISNGHLDNLRSSLGCCKKVLHYEKTWPTKVSIGERRKPTPNGVPGYLRLDTVHKGDGRRARASITSTPPMSSPPPTTVLD